MPVHFLSAVRTVFVFCFLIKKIKINTATVVRHKKSVDQLNNWRMPARSNLV